MTELVGKARRTPKRMLRSLIPFPYRNGWSFSQRYRFLEKSQWFSIEALHAYQWKIVKRLLDHSYQNVPYYRKLFNDIGMEPGDIKTPKDFALIPVLTKRALRDNFDELIATNYARYNPVLSHTSGSTGIIPFYFYLDQRTTEVRTALWYRHWTWCGVSPIDRMAIFRGTLIDEFGRSPPIHFHRKENELHFSTFEMNERVLDAYADKLDDWKPALVRGYPSSVEILARHLLRRGIRLESVRAVHTSSENLTQSQREIIKVAFSAPVFDWYGHGESTVSAGECDQHSGLHVSMELGFTEFISTQNRSGDSDYHTIISTSLHNLAMPLIRYDTGDLVILSKNRCTCQRELSLIDKVIGRKADIIEGINGVQLSPNSFAHYWKYKVAYDLQGIEYVQIVQKATDTLAIRLVAERRPENERLILMRLKELVGDMNIIFEHLDTIPTGQKWRFTVSDLG